MSHYVAYHSTERMGYEYEPTGTFSHYSNKPLGFLHGAVGSRVWVITGKREKSGTVYSLAATFIASKVKPEDGRYLVSGKDGMYFEPAVVVTDEPWFKEIFRQQNRFSYGFNRIADDAIIKALLRAKNEHERKRAA